MELVIAAHKSVAELGVLGRAEDVHAIIDAERDATLAYLDELTKVRGGRRAPRPFPPPPRASFTPRPALVLKRFIRIASPFGCRRRVRGKAHLQVLDERAGLGTVR